MTVISPTRRIDVALPGSVSLGECLPTVLKFSGYESTSPQEAVHAWVLQRLGEDPLDTTKRVAALNLRDGETLHLRQRENVMPDAAFDDVVDAVTTATTARPSWTPPQSQWAAVVAMCALLVGIPVVMLGSADLAAPFGGLVEAGLTLFVGLLALVGSIVLSRAFGSYLPAAGLSWASVTLAAVGGLYLMPTQPWSLRVLLASACALVFSATSWLAARVQPYAVLAIVLASAALLLASMVMVLTGAATAVAAVAVAVVLAMTSALPTLSYHAARVAMPNLPATAEALMADDQPVQSDIVTRAITADKVLGAFLTATGVTVILLMVPILAAGSWLGLALGAAVAVALMLRARAFVGRTQRTALLVSGLVVGAAVIALTLLALSPLWRAVAGIGIAVFAVAALAGYAAAMYDKILTPVWGRFGDILEWLSIMAIVPLVLGVLDVYGLVLGFAASR